MIFKKTEQFDKISDFNVNRFGLFCLTTDLQIPQIPEIELELAGFEKMGTEIALVGDFLMAQDGDGREILYDLEHRKMMFKYLDVDLQGYGFTSSEISTNRILHCRKMIDGEFTSFLFNADSQELTPINKQFSVTLDGGRVLLRIEMSSSSLARVELESNDLWEYKFEGTYIEPIRGEDKPCGLYLIVGIHEQLLWLSDHSGELFALDVETGEKVFSSFDVGPPNYFSIDNKNRRLVSLTSDCLRTIDLSTGQFELSKIDMGEALKKLDVRPDNMGRPFLVADTHLIFCDRHKSVIGTVCIDSGEIDWVHDLFDSRNYAMISNMVYYNEKLYVHDNYGSNAGPRGSLHIFDKV